MLLVRCKLFLLGSAGIIALTAGISFGQLPATSFERPLPLNESFEREIRPSEEHIYKVTLKRGYALRLNLFEISGANYVFRLLRATDGAVLAESDLTSLFGQETITYIATE